MAFTAAGKPGPLADINVTPLVDVMLVLLIIFIVTAPMVSMPIPVNLPQPTTVVPPISPPPPIELRVDASNQVSWNGQAVAVGSLQQRMQDAAHANTGNLPELRIATDPNAEYDVMAKVLAAANNAHMEKIAFVSP
ncbi:biopolymer transporter ExbD [uncultured Stenotrophomonas sp.]|uniref:ExbD/TolR family protein n=1 Tax=uncultured Stenotrophomonas sp. TaxID=165438 RepID=UPI0028D89E7F|nr:biopolymer transporter ExbD [uncultured Stenotrophomonas sp.]